MAYQNDKYPVNTNSFTFFSKDSMMRVNFSDSLLILSIRDAHIDENGKRTFPRPAAGDKSGIATLTPSRAAIFLKRIDNVFVPKFNEYLNSYEEDKSFDKMASVAVILNKDSTSLLSLTTNRPDAKNGYEPAVQICTNLSAESRIPESVKTFVFDEKIPVVTDYDPTTGAFLTCETDYPQILLFRAILEQFIEASTGAIAHSVNVELKERINTLSATVNQIAASNGIAVPSKNNYVSSNSSVFNTESNNEIATVKAPELKPYDENLAEFGDEIPF